MVVVVVVARARTTLWHNRPCASNISRLDNKTHFIVIDFFIIINWNLYSYMLFVFCLSHVHCAHNVGSGRNKIQPTPLPRVTLVLL